MITEILNAITNRLDANFQEYFEDGKVVIYTDESTQGISNPCFFIYLVDSDVSGETFYQYRNKETYSIVFMPLSDMKLRDKLSILQKLQYAMESIKLSSGDWIGGVIESANLVDECPNLVVRYNYKTIKDIYHPNPDIESPENMGDIGTMDNMIYTVEVKNEKERD